MAISAKDIERGLWVQRGKNRPGQILQASWKHNDNIDQFILAGTGVFMPMPYLNAAQMAIYLSDHKFEILSRD